jgi:hypothetical protein
MITAAAARLSLIERHVRLAQDSLYFTPVLVGKDGRPLTLLTKCNADAYAYLYFQGSEPDGLGYFLDYPLGHSLRRFWIRDHWHEDAELIATNTRDERSIPGNSLEALSRRP